MPIKTDDSTPFDPLSTILPPPGMKEMPSGLVVPKDATMKREVWLHDEAKKFRRLLKFLDEKQLDYLLKCKACNALLSVTRQLDGTLTLDCECAYRELRR